MATIQIREVPEDAYEVIHSQHRLVRWITWSKVTLSWAAGSRGASGPADGAPGSKRSGHG